MRLPDGPGLGIEPDTAALAPYLKQVEIVVDGKTLYTTPELSLPMKAVVTGTSNGIGLAIARAFTADGIEVIGLDVEPGPTASRASPSTWPTRRPSTDGGRTCLPDARSTSS